MDCLRRKHPKKREHKKHHRHVSPNVSPNHSQPSTLKTTVNSTLPKAGSTGLWIDTPGMYALAPPQNYYYGRPQGYKVHGMDHGYHGYHIPRTVSETRIPPPGPPYIPYGHHFAGQNNTFLMPVPGQRFYHSQPLAPVYELPPTRGMEIYDYPPYPGANGAMFRSKLLETRHTPEYYNSTSEFILKPRVERSKSDAENRKPTKPLGRREQSKETTTSSAENARWSASKEKKNWQALLEDDKKQHFKPSGVQKTTQEKVNRIHTNNALPVAAAPTLGISTPSKDHNSKTSSMDRQLLRKDTTALESANLSSSENMSSLATDSMKLIAKNKTDDQKTKPTFTPVIVDNNSNRMDENNREFNIKHYTYEGSIYAMPEKNIKNDDYYDNPLINRMKDMVIEKSRHSNALSHNNDWGNNRESTLPRNDIQPVASEFNVFKDATKVTKVTKTKVVETITTASVADTIHTGQQTNTFNGIIDGLVLPDILFPDEDSYRSPSPRAVVQHQRPERSATATAAEIRNDLTQSTMPGAERVTGGLLPERNVDRDSGSDDLNRAGNQLATSAFQFLDKYLSDDEGTESLVESPPLSPGGLRAGQVY